MWFQVDEQALDDPRIELLAARLGVSFPVAFTACCRIWRWLYRRESGVIPQEEVDVVARVDGMADQLVAVGLAEATPEGVRIKGDKRAINYQAFRRLQKVKSNKALSIRSGRVMAKANEYPTGGPSGDPRGIYILSESGSDPDPESGKTTARARQDAARIAAQEAASVWLEWFNRRFVRSFRVTQELFKQVGGLLARGFTEKPDMRGVALYLRSRWEEDEKMAQYLVPSSILRAGKFPERLDLAREWAKEQGLSLWDDV